MFSLSFNTDVLSGNMGSRHSNDSLFTLQKLEEILPVREIQMALLKLWSYYSEKNHSAEDSKKTNATFSNKDKAVHQLALLNESSQDNCPDAEESYKREMERNLSSVERSETLLANSSGSEFDGNSGAGKQVLVVTEIEQMNRRLEFLEKESKTMKQELFEEVEEREKLMNEICQQFQIIYGRLQLENPVIGERGLDESLKVNTFHQIGDSCSSIVTRSDQSTKTLALMESPEDV